MEFLNRFGSFMESQAKLVHSHVMDALETTSSEQKDTNDLVITKIVKMLDGVANASREKRKSVALGSDIRLESE
jgi:exoribonuclease II